MSSLYNRQNPFLAAIKERYSLCKGVSEKNTQHLVLDIASSDIAYEVGDSVGVFPKNDRTLVEKTLKSVRALGNEKVSKKQSSESISFHEFLFSHANISDVSPRLFREVQKRQTNPEKKARLDALTFEENHRELKAYLEGFEVWDFLLAHEEVVLSPQEIVDMLMPLLPRFYSIASSQKVVGNEIHLTVAPLEYQSNGQRRKGVCSQFLCEYVELNQPKVPIFIQSSHGFHLPQDLDVSMIMVGPGTGIAPFRGFLQERFLHHRSKGKHWLFFGEWNQSSHFFYENDWEHLERHGNLRMSLAFSRDQKEKIYVQHRMMENGEEFFQWLERGAYLYVCGNAEKMAKDVEAALFELIQKHGKQTEIQAKEYIKLLRQQKRYLRDVY